MQQPTRDLWQQVPGYTSDEEASRSREPTPLQLESRLMEVLASLSCRGMDRPMMQFRAAPLPGSKASSQSTTRNRNACNVVPPAFLLNAVDAPLLQETFLYNGMTPTLGSDYTIQWSGPNIKDSVYQNMTEWQRINHFPGSTELTRKDRLWLHFADMARSFGSRCFDFVPETYVLPDQFDDFLRCYQKARCTWIVKPNSSSRGRGIFILQDLSELPVDETVVVSRYVTNPLLIQGLKFDLRVYVLVTSFEPLKAFIYREGLTRFASAPYSTKEEHMQEAFRHLTNYSINKNSCTFVENSDLRCDNVGHKWSLSALNKHLRCVGVDVDLMWTRIMDLIVKTLLSVEPAISSRTRQMTAGRENCFELYGFDVLVDEDLKPWLLEVNLSPSMQAESPLDWQIKSSLLADTFNLVGVCSSDRSSPKTDRNRTLYSQPWRQASTGTSGKADSAKDTAKVDDNYPPVALNSLPDATLKMLAKSIGERSRCRNFVPLYPTRATVKRYGVITEGRAQQASVCRSHFPTAALSLSQIWSSILYGPHPVRSATEMRRQAGESRIEDEEAADVEFENVPVEAARDNVVADLDSILKPPRRVPWKEPLPGLSSPLPAGVDPGSSLEDREYALMAARRTLRALSGRAAREHKSKADAEAADSSDGGSSQEDAASVSVTNTGSCLLLMEYVMRMEAACESLGPAARARLVQGTSYARLSNFQRQLPVAAAKAFPERAFDYQQAGLESGSLVEDMIASCRDSFQILEQVTWQKAERDSDAFPEDKVATDKPRASPSCNGILRLSKRLPKVLLHDQECKKLLKVLPELRAADLESLMHGQFGSSASSDDGLCPMLECLKTFTESEDEAGLQRSPSQPGCLSQSTSSACLTRCRSSVLPVIGAEPCGPERRSQARGPLTEILAAAAAAHGEPARCGRRTHGPGGRRSSPKHRGLGATRFTSWSKLHSAKTLPSSTVMKEVTASLANRISMPGPRFVSSGIRRPSKPRAVPELLPEVKGAGEGHRLGSKDACESPGAAAAAHAAASSTRFDIEL